MLYFGYFDVSTLLCAFGVFLLSLYFVSKQKFKPSSSEGAYINVFKKTVSVDSSHLGHSRNSYFDLRRGLDSYSFYNVAPKYNRLPEDIIFLIENIKVFGHFDDKILLDLCFHIETRTLLAGEELCDTCSPSDNIFVVQSGELEVSILSNHGKKHCIKKAQKV